MASIHSQSLSRSRSPSPTIQEKLPPPIIVPTMAWRNAAPKLVTTVPADSIQVKAFRNDSVKIQCSDSEMFRIVQKYFKLTNTNFYTFPKPDERNLKIIFRGLPTDISEDDLSTELKSLGYEINFVRQFVKAGRKLPIHMVSLLSNPFSKGIFNIHSLFFISVKVEPYRSNNPAQCYNCQRFGHSSLHCGFPPRCLKCALDHPTKDCKKSLEVEPKCSNCLGSHTSNFKQCPVFIKTKLAKQPPNPSKPSQPKTPLPHPKTQQTQSTLTQPNISYANIAAKNTQEPPKPTSSPSSSPNTHSILQILSNLLTDLASGTANTKDALITTITAIIPLLLNLT